MFVNPSEVVAAVEMVEGAMAAPLVITAFAKSECLDWRVKMGSMGLVEHE